MFFRQIGDDKLAQYAYLVGCERTGEALLIDPERDIDRYVGLADAEELEIRAVAETHIHADFLSGAREFAERLGTRLYLSDEGDENWKYEWVKNGEYEYTLLRDGDLFSIGQIEIRAVHTPGHTPEHLCFMITDRGGGADEPIGLASGDFIFVGDLGRPDLLETAAKIEGAMEPSARTLHGSALRFMELPDYLQVWPGHGAGSACGKALGAVPETTVGYERRFNPALRAARESQQAFVDFILDGQPEPPLYFARMKRDNKLGSPLLGALPTPTKLTARELAEIPGRKDTLVIDTRTSRSDFMSRHLPGALYAPLTRSFNTAVGSVVEDETTSLVLIIEECDLEEAIRDLVRIGHDRITGFAEPETLARYFEDGGASSSIETIDFERMVLLREERAARVLDVRYASEYAVGRVPGAIQAAYTRLPELERSLPRDETLLVHCGTGARAAVASAFLSRRGHDVKYVDDDFLSYARLGPVERDETVAVWQDP